MYKCSKCGLEVVVVKKTNEIIRACNCVVSGIEIKPIKYLFGLITINKKITTYSPAVIIAEASVNLKGVGKSNI